MMDWICWKEDPGKPLLVTYLVITTRKVIGVFLFLVPSTKSPSLLLVTVMEEAEQREADGFWSVLRTHSVSLQGHGPPTQEESPGFLRSACCPRAIDTDTKLTLGETLEKKPWGVSVAHEPIYASYIFRRKVSKNPAFQTALHFQIKLIK